MADDYLLTAIENFTSGFGKTLGESKQLEYQDALARRRDREQNALLSNKQKEQADLELSQFKQKLPLQEQSQIRIAQATKETQPGTEIVDSEGNIIRTTKNKVEKLPKPERPFDDTDRKEFLKQSIKDLPKLKETAYQNKTSLQVIGKLEGLVEKGVTGKAGQLKAILAGYPSFFGGEIENLTEAQTFETLSRLLAGPIRTDIVGPGQVSNYEQQLLEKVSGGGGTAKSAVKELLKFYKDKANNNIENYNNTLEGAKTLSPRFGQLYEPINTEAELKKSPLDTTKKTTGFKSSDEILNYYLGGK